MLRYRPNVRLRWLVIDQGPFFGLFTDLDETTGNSLLLEIAVNKNANATIQPSRSRKVIIHMLSNKQFIRPYLSSHPCFQYQGFITCQKELFLRGQSGKSRGGKISPSCLLKKPIRTQDSLRLAPFLNQQHDGSRLVEIPMGACFKLQELDDWFVGSGQALPLPYISGLASRWGERGGGGCPLSDKQLCTFPLRLQVIWTNQSNSGLHLHIFEDVFLRSCREISWSLPSPGRGRSRW